MEWLHAIAGFAVFVIVAVVTLSFWGILKCTLRGSDHRVDDVNRFPRTMTEPLEAHAADLMSLGFEPLGWTSHQLMDSTIGSRLPQYWLHDPGRSAFAHLTWLPPSPQRGNIQLTVYTPGADGSLLMTREDSKTVTQHPTGHRVRWNHVPLGSGCAEIVSAHRRWVATLAAKRAAPDEALAQYAEVFDALPADLAEAGILQLTEDGRYRYTVAQAARRALAWGRVIAVNTAGTREESLPLELEAIFFDELRAARTRPVRRGAWLTVLCVSGVLTTASMALLFDVATGLTLVAAIGVHEAGHLLAMRVLGYRNLGVLFIPFLGGAATGERDEGTLSEELTVLLAGPVPSLFIAPPIALVAHSMAPLADRVVFDALLIVSVLNFLNLLPVMPLDGGKVVHALWFAGRPLADPVFRVLCAASLFAAGVALSDSLLIGLGVAVTLALRSTYAQAKVERQLRNSGAVALAPRDRLLRVLATLRQHHPAQPFASRMLSARQLVARLEAPVANGGVRVAWTVAYGGLLIGAPVWVIVFLALMNFPAF